MANGLLLRLRERELSASPAERNVIAYVSAHPHEVVGLSVRGLADATFSSPSSILRFCKRLGFAGYKEFQRELIAELALLCAKNMHEGDMAIAFSYSGLTQEVLDCTAEAQRHNCPVVAVTKVDGSSKLATMADAVLGVAASEPLVRSGAMASRMAQLMVVDALYAAYVASDYERATHVIKQNYIEKQER